MNPTCVQCGGDYEVCPGHKVSKPTTFPKNHADKHLCCSTYFEEWRQYSKDPEVPDHEPGSGWHLCCAECGTVGAT